MAAETSHSFTASEEDDPVEGFIARARFPPYRPIHVAPPRGVFRHRIRPGAPVTPAPRVVGTALAALGYLGSETRDAPEVEEGEGMRTTAVPTPCWSHELVRAVIRTACADGDAPHEKGPSGWGIYEALATLDDSGEGPPRRPIAFVPGLPQETITPLTLAVDGTAVDVLVAGLPRPLSDPPSNVRITRRRRGRR